MSITASVPQNLQRPTNVRHGVLLSLLAITAINYIQRNAISPAATTIQSDLHLTLEAIGAIMGAFFWAYTLMQVPSGLLAQRMGAKWTLVFISAGWSLAIAGCAVATDFFTLCAGRVLMGVLQAGIFSCATLILKVWYPASRRGLATALLTSFMLIGGVIGSFLTGLLLGPLGWRGVFALYVLPGLAWAGWFAWWFHSRPEDHPGVNRAELGVIADLTENPAEPPTALAPQAKLPAPAIVWKRGLFLLALLTIALICTQQFFRAGANRLFDMWIPTYFEVERETTRKMAAYLSGFLQAMGVVGVMAGGLLTDAVLRRTGSRWAARNGVALVSLLGSVGLYLLAWPIGNLYLSTAVFSLGVLVFCASSPCSFALTMDIGGSRLALIFSVMNMSGNLGSASFVSFLPHFIRLGGWPLALAVFVGMHLAAAVCWFLLNPRACIDDALGPRRTE